MVADVGRPALGRPPRGDILTLRADGSVDRLHVGDVAAFVRPRTSGGWVVATERGLALADDPDGIPTPSFDLWDDPTVRMNEGGVDGAGRSRRARWATTACPAVHGSFGSTAAATSRPCCPT